MQTLCWQQARKLRRSIAPKGRGHMTDATNVMPIIVLRQVLYAYLNQIFPKLSDSIANFDRREWLHEVYGMTETGRLNGSLVAIAMRFLTHQEWHSP